MGIRHKNTGKAVDPGTVVVDYQEGNIPDTLAPQPPLPEVRERGAFTRNIDQLGMAIPQMKSLRVQCLNLVGLGKDARYMLRINPAALPPMLDTDPLKPSPDRIPGRLTSGERAQFGAPVYFKKGCLEAALAKRSESKVQRGRGGDHKSHIRQGIRTARQNGPKMERCGDQSAGPRAIPQSGQDISRKKGLAGVDDRPLKERQKNTEFKAIHVLRGHGGYQPDTPDPAQKISNQGSALT